MFDPSGIHTSVNPDCTSPLCLDMNMVLHNCNQSNECNIIKKTLYTRQQHRKQLAKNTQHYREAFFLAAHVTALVLHPKGLEM